MSALGVVYGKAPRGRPIFDTDDIFLQIIRVIRCQDLEVISIKKGTA